MGLRVKRPRELSPDFNVTVANSDVPGAADEEIDNKYGTKSGTVDKIACLVFL